MKWLNFLHFYQPINQQPDILEAVVKQSYHPIFKKITERDNVSISMNISGALLELFERDHYTDLLALISDSVKAGRVELTGSCKFHAFIPLIPESEIKRQIEQNTETLQRVLGFDYTPEGFFPPEMGYHPKLNSVLQELDYKWLIIDEIAAQKDNNFPRPTKLYKLENTDITVFFRDRRVSNLIMSAVARNLDTLKNSIKDCMELPYLVTGMDGETFGHHRIGFETFLFRILQDPSLGVTSVHNFLATPPELPTESITPLPSTWASSIEDIEKNIQFLSWKDPENPIHAIQWEFLNFTLDKVTGYSKDHANYKEVRHKMDVAMASDHFWWASAKPWWSLEMIEDGAYRLMDVVSSMDDIPQEDIYKSYKYYQDIVSKAATWQREGIIRKIAVEQNEILRIPFKERTLEKGGAEEGVYWAFMDMLREQEKLAADRGDYEKAILWRDAYYKLDHKYDIYDAINVIDLLRIEIGNGEIERIIEKYKDKYSRIRGGQPEQRGS